jgi:magnesium transporter
MSRLIKKRSKTIGLPPGSLIHVGEKKSEDVKITVIDYDEKNFEEIEVKSIKECFPFKDKPTVTWINIDGISRTDIIEKIGNNYGLHPLVSEDILNTGQRPKFEDYDDYIYIVLKMLYQPKEEILAEQISIILGKNYVLSFQETSGDVFQNIRDRIRNAKGRIRKMGADYLAYSLIDSIVDNYYIVLETLGDKIEEIEDNVVHNPTPEILKTIHGMKRELIFLKKSVWPLREVISNLNRAESNLIKKSILIFIRDLYDHTIQVIDTIETFRDMNSGMLDIYMSSVSNRMNDVMKVLTIFAAIFIPLTFIAGIYGMNFQYMPELGWKWGYFTVIGLMGIVGITLLFYFRLKKWI